jgi:hypothetical protein
MACQREDMTVIKMQSERFRVELVSERLTRCDGPARPGAGTPSISEG